MSVRKEQTTRVMEDVARALYASGVAPTLNEVFSRVADYFSQYPAGEPLPMPLDYIEPDAIADVDKFNLILAHLSMNLDVLYQVCLDQVNEAVLLSDSLLADLQRLQARRHQLETQIDDYLLSQFNTDGYYFSLSDVFADTSMSDLTMTSAYIDTALGAVTLPTISSLSHKLEPKHIGNPTIEASVTVGGVTQNVPHTETAPWSGAIDGLSNTVWEIQVETSVPSEVVVTVMFAVGSADHPASISRVDYNPYGITEVQAYVESVIAGDGINAPTFKGFGGKIETSESQMSFLDTWTEVTGLRLTLRKTKFDYLNAGKYRYVFGARDVGIVEQVYDNEATFVTELLAIPPDLQNDMVIDAVSLSANTDTPPGTTVQYYVAAEPDTGDATTMPVLEDYTWREIQPIGDDTNNASNIVHFDGAEPFTVFIRDVPGPGDLQMIGLDAANTDINQRNPSPVIVPGEDVYRIAKFDDTPLTGSMTLDEGINVTRIYHASLSPDAVKSLDWWAAPLAGLTQAATPVPTSQPDVAYGRIDTGNEFFYGADVGESGRSIYIETYLDSVSDQETLLSELRKSDPNSQTWSVRVFLNGREIGWLPGDNPDTVGTPLNSLVLPWTFRQGLNHVSLLINIPDATPDVPNPYVGTIELLRGRNLFDYGTVKLGTWSYVDFFDLQHNQTGDPQTFSVYNGEIVSRRKPTTNYRLQYNKSTARGPLGVRLRADLSRSTDSVHVTPKFMQYRMRFSYGAQNG